MCGYSWRCVCLPAQLETTRTEGTAAFMCSVRRAFALGSTRASFPGTRAFVHFEVFDQKSHLIFPRWCLSGMSVAGAGRGRHIPYRCLSSVLAQSPDLARERGVCPQQQPTAEARLRGKVFPQLLHSGSVVGVGPERGPPHDPHVSAIKKCPASGRLSVTS